VEETHTGYFSIDKKGKAIDSKIKRGQDSSDDISAYDLILKNKERILSFQEPVRFIFSHSALREGWDNPNVFQICTLKHSDSQIAKRQEVGRGLRLCVNQNGDRMDKESLGELVHDMNVLTVIASDSYSEFVRDLQKDIKDNLYDRPTKATREYFFGKIVETEEGSREITVKEASDILFYLIKSDYINNDFEVTDKYHKDLENDELLPVPEDLKEMEEGIHYLVQAIFDESVLDKMIKNDHETKLTDNELNDNFYKKEFQSLWNLINNKYSYKVKFDSEELVDKAIKYIDDNLKVSKLQYTISQGIQHEELDEHAFDRLDSFEVLETKTQVLDHASISQVEYDLVGKIAEETVLTRGTIVKILKGIEERTFQMFKDNPEEFITKVTRLINSQKATMVVDHITYNRTENKYDSSIFTAGSKNKNIKNALKTNKHIQDYVFVDGISEDSVESRFAKSIDRADEVVVYAKLPKGFAIPTPVGNYTPDWAIAFKEGAVKHVYFIAETKGSLDSMELRNIEKAKIDCAKSLFNNISTDNLRYDHVTDYQSLLNIVK
jgi:type III restriction enzyme